MLTKDIPREDGHGHLRLAFVEEDDLLSINSVGESRTVIIGMSSGEARALAWEILRILPPLSKQMRESISEAIRDQRLGRLTTVQRRVLSLAEDNGIVDYE